MSHLFQGTKMGLLFTFHWVMILTFYLTTPLRNILTTPTFMLPKPYWILLPIENSLEMGSIILKVKGIDQKDLVNLDGGVGDLKINGPGKDNWHIVLQQKLKLGSEYSLIITASGPVCSNIKL